MGEGSSCCSSGADAAAANAASSSAAAAAACFFLGLLLSAAAAAIAAVAAAELWISSVTLRKRICWALLPKTNSIASMTLLFPEPFGPTMAVKR